MSEPPMHQHLQQRRRGPGREVAADEVVERRRPAPEAVDDVGHGGRAQPGSLAGVTERLHR